MSKKSLYEILHVHPQAEAEVIQVAFEKLKIKFQTTSVENAHHELNLLNAAYEILIDEKKRSHYDLRIAKQMNETVSVLATQYSSTYKSEFVEPIPSLFSTKKTILLIFVLAMFGWKYADYFKEYAKSHHHAVIAQENESASIKAATASSVKVATARVDVAQQVSRDINAEQQK